MLVSGLSALSLTVLAMARVTLTISRSTHISRLRFAIRSLGKFKTARTAAAPGITGCAVVSTMAVTIAGVKYIS